MKIVAVTAGFPGVLQWLRHGQAERFWDLVVLPESDEPTQIDIPPADVHLFGAYHPAYWSGEFPPKPDGGIMDQLRLAYPNAKIIDAWSSSPFEMESAAIEMAFASGFRTEVGRKAFDAIACLHPGVVPLFENGFHLPAPLHLEENMPFTPPEERVGIGLFAPAGIKKNIAAQLIAVKKLQRDDPSLILKTNCAKYKPVLDGWGIAYELLPWEPDRRKHLERLSEVKVSLAASVGESWNYGACDAMAVGVPVVGSATVPCVPDSWRVVDANDPLQIVDMVHGLLGPLFVSAEPDGIKAYLKRLSKAQNERVRAVLAELEAGKVPA